MTTKRKLAAIVFVDIAGFTDRANRDERVALELRDAFEKQVKAAVLSHHGRVVKMLGDGGMLEFASAVEAVSCALAIQDSAADVTRQLALEDPLQLRIGVHAGDVVEEDDDLFGNAVNIASRVQAMAKPGSVLITREVYQQIRPILNLRCTPVSSKADGRMPEPVEVLRVEGEIEAESAPLPRPRYRFAFGLIGVLAALAFATFLMRPTGTPPTAPVKTVHRILLPDWVSPGEWFEIDAGPRAASLSVYFGNREAQCKVEDGKLMVQTPSDLPPERTTISVFEQDESEPMMTQATHIVRPTILASNQTPVSDSASGWDPASEPQTNPVQAPKPDPARGTTKQEKTPASTDLPKPKPTDSRPVQEAASKPTKVEQSREQLENVMVLDQIGRAFEAEFEPLAANVPTPRRPRQGTPPHSPPPPVIVAIRSAKSGDAQKAKEAIEETRKQLDELPPEVRKEVEALLKTAEALAADPSGKSVDPKAMSKWGEAFAFSMNHGTRSYSGIAMIDRMIEAGRIHDAKRAMNLMRQRENLTEGEKRSLDRLQRKLDEKQSPAP